MSRFTHCLTLLALLLCAGFGVRADHLTAKYLFAARMNSAQEVPVTTSSAVGVATFSVNNSADTLCITMTVNGLSGPITGVHIHEGKAGVAGPIITNLVPFLTGSSLQATLTGIALSGLHIDKLLNGEFYINVHTAAHPGGEIRGQIMLEEDRGMVVRMSGAEENPAIVTPARGLAFFKLSQHNQNLSVYVVLDSLIGTITGAHLHSGKVGSNGPVIQNLMPLLSGNVINGNVDPSAYLDAILADSVYINVHTTTALGGLIRGQLHFEPYLHFEARMDGAQEAPPVTTSAVGLGVFRLNYTMDTVWYDLLTNGLSGAINAAHIHRGPVGISGGVLVPFPSANISGSRILGSAPLPPTAATDTLRRLLMEGGLYANVHTTVNPGGEVRGQIFRTIREGYTFSITGDQEVPAVASPAYGSGMVSIDRDQTNAHFMIVGTNITPTAAHFHRGMWGVSGPVIFNLGSYMANNGVYGYWRENDATAPFSVAFSEMFRADTVYVNMHTAANPSGEIRGQVLRSLCTSLPKATTGIKNISNEPFDLNVYPNPAEDVAHLELNLPKPMQASLQLVDVTGRMVWKSARVFAAGTQEISLPISKLPAGLYYVRFVSLEGQITRKLLKK